jgi:hypothetical protein
LRVNLLEQPVDDPATGETGEHAEDEADGSVRLESVAGKVSDAAEPGQKSEDRADADRGHDVVGGMPMVGVVPAMTYVTDVTVVCGSLMTGPDVGDAEEERQSREDETEKEASEKKRIQQVVDDKHRQPPAPVATSGACWLLTPLPGAHAFEFAGATLF